jgi:hypothetical protein
MNWHHYLFLHIKLVLNLNHTCVYDKFSALARVPRVSLPCGLRRHKEKINVRRSVDDIIVE